MFWRGRLGGNSGSTRPPATSGAIVDATGGSVAVTDPSSPIFGTIVSIAPGSLGATFDSITIDYADALPSPLRTDAVAAGAVAVSKTIKLARGLSNSFSQPVEVTIPYDASTVGADDYPVVFYPG